MLIFELIHGLFIWGKWRSRHKLLKSLVRFTIEAEGGAISRISLIGAFVRSPFPRGGEPIYLRADCHYDSDRGSWFVRESSFHPTMWVWRSDLECESLPAPRGEAAFVDNRIIVVPVWLTALGYVALFVATIVLVVLLLLYS